MKMYNENLVPAVAFVACAFASAASFTAAYTENTVENGQSLRIEYDEYGRDDAITVKDGGTLVLGDYGSYELGKLSLQVDGTLNMRIDGVFDNTVPIMKLTDFECFEGSKLVLTLKNISNGLSYVLLSCDNNLSGSLMPSLDLQTEGTLSWVGNSLVYTAPGGSPGGLYFNPVTAGNAGRGFYYQYSPQNGYSNPVADSTWKVVGNFSQDLDIKDAYIKFSASAGDAVTARGSVGDLDTKGVWLSSGQITLDPSMDTSKMGKIFVIDGRLGVNGNAIANEVYLGASSATYKGAGFALHAEGNSSFTGAVSQVEETGILLGKDAVLNFAGTYNSASKLKLKLAEAGSSATIRFSNGRNTAPYIYMDEGEGTISLAGSAAVSTLEAGRGARLDISGASLAGLANIKLGDLSGLTITAGNTLALETFSNGRYADITLAGVMQTEMDRVYNILTASTHSDGRNNFITVTVNGYREYASWGTTVVDGNTVDALTYRPSYYWNGKTTDTQNANAFTNAAGQDSFGWKDGNSLVIGDYVPGYIRTISVKGNMSVDSLIIRGSNEYIIDTAWGGALLSAKQTIIEEGARMTLLVRNDGTSSFSSDIYMKAGAFLVFGNSPDSAWQGTHISGNGTIELQGDASFRQFVYNALTADGAFNGVLKVGAKITLDGTLDVSTAVASPGVADINNRLANTAVEIIDGGNITFNVKYQLGEPDQLQTFDFNMAIAGSGYKENGKPEHAAALSFIGDSGTKLGGSLTLTGNSTIYVKDGIYGSIQGAIKASNPSYDLVKTGGGELKIYQNGGWAGNLIIEGGQVTLEGSQALNVSGGKCINGIILKAGVLDIGANRTNDISFLMSKDLVFAGAGEMTVKGYRGLGFYPGYSKVVYAEGATGKATITADIDEVYTYGNGPLEFSVAKSAVQGTNPELTVSGNVGRPYGEGSAYGFAVLKSGQGTLLFSGENAYIGGTTVSWGKLIAASAKALGSGDVAVRDSASLVLDASVNLGSGKTVLVDKGGMLSATANGNLAANLVMKSGAVLESQAKTCFTGNVAFESGVLLSDVVMGRAQLGMFSGQNDVVVLDSFSVKVGAGQSLTLGNVTWYGTQLSGFEQGVAYELSGDASLVFGHGGNVPLDLSDMAVWITYTGSDYQITLSSAGKDKIFFNTGGSDGAARGFYMQHTDAFGYKRTVTQDVWVLVDDFSSPLNVSGESDLYIKLDASKAADRRVVASGAVGYGSQYGTGTKGTWITGGTVAFAPDLDVESAGEIFAVDGTLEISGDCSWTNNVHLGGNGGDEALAMTGDATTFSGKVDLMETTRISVAQSSTGHIAGTISGAADAALVKTGAGSLRLSGSNTWSGGTAVEAGRLIVGSASALGSGDVTVRGGAVLEVASAINIVNDANRFATITVQAGGTLAGESLMGTIHANLVMESGSVIDAGKTLDVDQNWTMQAGTTLTDYFIGKISQARAGGGINLLTGEMAEGQSFTLGRATYDYQQLFAMKDNGPFVLEADASSIFRLQEGSVYDLGNCPIYADVTAGAAPDTLSYRLFVETIPEPSTAATGLLGLAMLLMRRRRAGRQC